MNEAVENPYAPPRAEVAPPLSQGRVFSAFPRLSTWAVFGLAIVTLSLYVYYWLYSRTRILNRLIRDESTDLHPSDQISPSLIWSALGFAVLNFVLSFAVEFTELDPNTAMSLSLLTAIISLGGSILYLVWAFKFRNRVNALSKATSGDRYWLSGILTFFLSGLYLPYKINQLIDRETRGE